MYTKITLMDSELPILLNPKFSRVMQHLTHALAYVRRPETDKYKGIEIGIGTRQTAFEKREASPWPNDIEPLFNVQISVNSKPITGYRDEDRDKYVHSLTLFFWKEGFIRGKYRFEAPMEVGDGCELPIIEWFLEKVQKSW